MFFLLKEKSPDTPRDSGMMSRLQDLPCGCQSNAAEVAATWSSHHAVPGTEHDSVIQNGRLPDNRGFHAEL